MRHLIFACLAALSLAAQVPDNKSLNGKYYFREVQLAPDSGETRSLFGSITFDGNGGFSWQGQQLVGQAGPAAANGNGVYSVKASGLVTLADPIRAGATINGRLGTGALIGSDTEAGNNVFSIFTALPVPTGALATSTLAGPYWIASLGFLNGSQTATHETFFKVSSNGSGSFGDVIVTGQAMDLTSALKQQTVPSASYTVASDGTGTLNFPIAASGALLSGVKTMYLAQDGSFFIAGGAAAGGHGILIGIRAGAGLNAAALKGNYFTADLQTGTQTGSQTFSDYAGSVSSDGKGNLVASRRNRASSGAIDVTALNLYNLIADGSGYAGFNSIAVSSNSQLYISSGVSFGDSRNYEITFGVRAPALSGSGVFLNPQGIFNAATFAPVGNPVSPGGFVTMFGTNLAGQTTVATKLPFSTTLGGVQVLVNNVAAPLYFVSPGQISALIPYATTGSTATIVVKNGSATSNAVDVPLAASSPGIFTIPQNGLGQSAVLHADFTLVGQDNPAHPGETVQIFLTGLGAVSPGIADGAPGPVNPLSRVTGPIAVYVGDARTPAVISYQGLAPTLAGLYQINAVIPVGVTTGNIPIAIQTNEAFTDLANIFVEP
jgi:uncharacterized protein (TIGR03437 family)